MNFRTIAFIIACVVSVMFATGTIPFGEVTQYQSHILQP